MFDICCDALTCYDVVFVRVALRLGSFSEDVELQDELRSRLHEALHEF